MTHTLLVKPEATGANQNLHSPAMDWLIAVNNHLTAFTNVGPNWDGEGAAAPDHGAISNARALLGIFGTIQGVAVPYLVPTPTGGLVFAWKNAEGDLELQIDDDATACYTYIDLHTQEGEEVPVSPGGEGMQRFLNRLLAVSRSSR